MWHRLIVLLIQGAADELKAEETTLNVTNTSPPGITSLTSQDSAP